MMPPSDMIQVEVKPEEKKMPVALIFLTVVGILLFLACIAAMIFIMIMPDQLSKAAIQVNEYSAISNLKALTILLVLSQQKDTALLYPVAKDKAPIVNETNKEFYNMQSSVEDAYQYDYYVNDARLRYIYVAYPKTKNNGTKIFMTDESNNIWVAPIIADKINIQDKPSKDWENAEAPQRMNIIGIGPWQKM